MVCVHLSITPTTPAIQTALGVHIPYRANRSLSFTNEVQSITILRVTRRLYQGIREEQIKILVLFSSHTNDDALNLKKINEPEVFIEGLLAIMMLNDHSIGINR